MAWFARRQVLSTPRDRLARSSALGGLLQWFRRKNQHAPPIGLQTLRFATRSRELFQALARHGVAYVAVGGSRSRRTAGSA
jgi:hypothetical protein